MFFLVLLVGSVIAAPVLVDNCGRGNCVLTYPRYKLIQSSDNPDELWVAYDNNGGINFRKSDDGGLSWDATSPSSGLTVLSWMDFHASLFKDPLNNIHLADHSSGQVFYRKINYPGASASDFESVVILSSPAMSGNTYGHVVAQDENNIFVMYRSNVLGGNVRYFRSTDGGATFPEEDWIVNTGLSEVRLGAFLLNGMPAAIVQHLTSGPSDTDFSYYVWDGNQFVANADSVISVGEQLGFERTFNMIYHNGQLHLAFSSGNRLVHSYKDYNGGTGTWTKQDVVNLGYTPAYYFQPMFSTHGNTLYLIYAQVDSSTDTSVSNIYYTTWNTTTSSWDSITQFTSDGGAGGDGYLVPHGPNIVPLSSTFIPIVYSKAPVVNNPTGIVYSDQILVGSAPDTTPPVRSNGAPSGSLPSGTTQISISLNTDEDATCKYDTSSGISYSLMTTTFLTTGTTTHSSLVTGLSDGNNYNYYVRCNDTSDNVNSDDFVISFSVANPGVNDADVNDDGEFNIIDLALTTFWRGKNNTQGDWNFYDHLDVDNNGLVNVLDVIEVLSTI